jgi:hypothetical protein
MVSAEATTSASTVPPANWLPVNDAGLGALTGTWISELSGDAIPDGPKGGKVVDGGVRVQIKRNKKGSKTPYSLTFWAPKDGHRDGGTISGGCGFYEDIHEGGKDHGGNLADWRAAYCRGYGKEHGSIVSHLTLETDGMRLRLSLDGWLSTAILKRK